MILNLSIFTLFYMIFELLHTSMIYEFTEVPSAPTINLNLIDE